MHFFDDSRIPYGATHPLDWWVVLWNTSELGAHGRDAGQLQRGEVSHLPAPGVRLEDLAAARCQPTPRPAHTRLGISASAFRRSLAATVATVAVVARSRGGAFSDVR